MSTTQTKSHTGQPVRKRNRFANWLPQSWREQPLTHSVVVHGLHKSATMFLFDFFKTVSADRGVDFYSPNIPDSEAPTDGSIHCYSPFRSFDFEECQNSDSPVRRIFHIRDPRDVLVSEYFSLGWIHPNDKGQMLVHRRAEIQQPRHNICRAITFVVFYQDVFYRLRTL